MNTPSYTPSFSEDPQLEIYPELYPTFTTTKKFVMNTPSFPIVMKIAGWWFGTFSIFPYIGLLIIPIDVHIFQRGGPTTNQNVFDGFSM